MNPHAAGLSNAIGNHEGSGQQIYDHGTVTRSSGGVRRPISDESWIEVSSRPSTSSLSSAATDEVVTTGLRVATGPSGRRRRQLHRSAAARGQDRTSRRAAGSNDSSQDEYDESESESDRVMTSSNEDLQHGFAAEDEQNDRSPLLGPRSGKSDVASINSAEGDDDDDENATALGVADPTPFTPQPHAFSHPPSARFSQRQATSQESYFPPVPTSAGASARQPQAPPNTTVPPTSRAHTRTRSHTPYNIIAPNHSVSVDHDAALRASLSTLLSCAAAARGLQKRESTPASASAPSRPPPPQRSRQHSRVEPGTLRIVPESALGKVEESPPALPQRPSPSSAGSPSSPVHGPPKRKAKSPARDRRKKHRSSTYALSDDSVSIISPTLTTWVVGAGVLVLFSAISFSAGYALGKEVGRVDAMGGGMALGCASEADGALGRGIARSRAWRWGNASGVRA